VAQNLQKNESTREIFVSFFGKKEIGGGRKIGERRGARGEKEGYR
jgi:hypothetical protein